MEHEKRDTKLDPLLLPLLAAKSESASDESLMEIMSEQVEPIIRKILKSRLRVSLTERGTQRNQDALEIAGDVRATIILALRSLRQSPMSKPIVSLPDFVAIKTYSACADYFREKHPQRWRLKNRLRRHLKQNPRCALWQAEDNRWYAGFSGPQEPGSDGNPASTAAVSHTGAEEMDRTIREPDDFLVSLFARARGPLDFDDVVNLAAETWDIHDRPIESIDVWHAEKNRSFTSPELKIDLALEQRLYLDQVWKEVAQLPVLQRAALLLNLRDSSDGGVISFLPLLGIASKEELALLLEIPYEAFEQLWIELPLDDLRIAGSFGITRQQVINLRKTARGRLSRRMRKFEQTRNRD